jgi:hypothetical protein
MVDLGVVKGSWDRNGGNVPEVRKVEVDSNWSQEAKEVKR